MVGDGGKGAGTPRVALVTGAARGIGFEVCRVLARDGMTVLLGARDAEKARAAAAELAGDGLDVRPAMVDVVWAATLPDDGPTGGFFRDGKPLPW